MSRSWNPPTPIEGLFEQLRVGNEITTKLVDDLSAPQLFRLGYKIICKKGLFYTACREWWDKSMADKTIGHLKVHLKKWGKDWQLTANSRLSVCHDAHHMETTAHHLLHSPKNSPSLRPTSGNADCPERTKSNRQHSSWHSVAPLNSGHSVHRHVHGIHCPHFTAGMLMDARI